MWRHLATLDDGNSSHTMSIVKDCWARECCLTKQNSLHFDPAKMSTNVFHNNSKGLIKYALLIVIWTTHRILVNYGCQRVWETCFFAIAWRRAYITQSSPLVWEIDKSLVNKFIAYYGVPFIRVLTVIDLASWLITLNTSSMNITFFWIKIQSSLVLNAFENVVFNLMTYLLGSRRVNVLVEQESNRIREYMITVGLSTVIRCRCPHRDIRERH